MKSFLGLIFILALVRGDEYYYNIRQWVRPVLSRVVEGARNGMDHSPKLSTALNVPSSQLSRLDFDIRERIAEHMGKEMTLIVEEMQRLIDIVVHFSLDLMSSLHDAVSAMSNEAPDAESIGNLYLDALIQRAKVAIKQIIDELDSSASQNVDDHLSGKVFQAMAIRIAREVLSTTSLVSMEKSVLSQVEAVLDAVFSDRKGEIEEGLMTDLVEDLQKLLVQYSSELNGREVQFREWISDLIRYAAQGAKPHIHQLRSYSHQVISRACQLCHDVSLEAYNYFFAHQSELGSVWGRMDKIVQMILDENKEI